MDDVLIVDVCIRQGDVEAYQELCDAYIAHLYFSVHSCTAEGVVCDDAYSGWRRVRFTTYNYFMAGFVLATFRQTFHCFILKPTINVS